MGILASIYFAFAPYADARERAVEQVFAGLTEHSAGPSTKARLAQLLQQNIAVINLWTEYRYKGYNYLKKGKRRQLYTNLDAIAADFDAYYQNNLPNAEDALLQIHGVAPGATLAKNQAQLLQGLTDYFSHNRGIYEYRESSSFGRLLRNPTTEPLVGDCNQIVTLYIYLYSQYLSVQDLKIRLLPGHVALHCGGVDIEATNGTFKNYESSDGQSLQPIEEIVCVNLLDTTDTHFAKHEVAPEGLLQATRFAFILSHDRNIVTQNLDAAYGKLINSLMERNNFAQALKFAKQSKNIELLTIVGNNGALYHMQQREFAAARRFAEYALKRAELTRDSYRAEGAYHYEDGRYHDAIKAFNHYGDQSLVKKCYEALFMAEQNKLGDNITSETVKQYTSVVKKMHNYAKKSGNKQLIDHANQLRKYL